jgi:hypothetical protein
MDGHIRYADDIEMKMLKLREKKHVASINCGEMAEIEVGDV